MSKLHHIGLGRAHKGLHVKLLIADQSIRVITLEGKLIRELTLDPTHDYQPLQPTLNCPGTPETHVRDLLRHDKVRPAGIEPAACGLKDRCSLAPRREPLTTELRARAGGI